MNILVTILLVVFSLIVVIGIVFWLVGERGRLYLPSTLVFIRQGGVRRFFNLNTLHGYVYMRWQKSYLSLFINRLGPSSTQEERKWWSDQYHGKVLTEEHARSIITIQEPIPLTDLEQIIPYPIAREIILTASPKITVYECGCRLARVHPCTPIQVCMFIGDPFASFMLEHHPRESRALTQLEALELLKAEHERGHIHTAWFKNAMHDRFYVMCNCCKCCCGGLETMVKHGISMMASSGYVVTVDENLCAGCGTCAQICPFEASSLDTHAVISWEKCMGCGVCVDQCPNGAMTLIRDERKGIPLDVKAFVHETSSKLTLKGEAKP